MLTIPVTAYVAAFFRSRYGLGPYPLRSGSKHPIAIAFRDVPAHAKIYSSVHAVERISIDATDGKEFTDLYKAHEQVFLRGILGVNMFWQDVLGQVDGTLHGQGNNFRQSLTDLMQRRALSEDDYSLENIERQFRRHRSTGLSRPGSREAYGIIVSAHPIKSFLPPVAK